MPKDAAVLITYLANVSEATSREIEMETGLRQSEVSMGMRVLHENNWVTEYEVKSERKGRPMKVYRLSIPIEQIIKHYEEEKGSRVCPSLGDHPVAKGNCSQLNNE